MDMANHLKTGQGWRREKEKRMKYLPVIAVRDAVGETGGRRWELILIVVVKVCAMVVIFLGIILQDDSDGGIYGAFAVPSTTNIRLDLTVFFFFQSGENRGAWKPRYINRSFISESPTDDFDQLTSGHHEAHIRKTRWETGLGRHHPERARRPRR